MTKYDVTLTKNIRMNKVDYVAGDKAEVDEVLLEELQKHDAVTNVEEKKAARKAPVKKAADKAEEGE